jgi:hypothetical protein
MPPKSMDLAIKSEDYIHLAIKGYVENKVH